MTTVAKQRSEDAGPLPRTFDRTARPIHLYCIVECGTDAERLLLERSIPGVADGEPLFPVAANGLVAAVSRVPPAPTPDEASDAQAVEERSSAGLVQCHERAIQVLLASSPAMVPFPPGAAFHTPERVERLLRHRLVRYRGLLRCVRGCRQWDLRVYRDPIRLQQAVIRSEPVRPPSGRLLARERDRQRVEDAEKLAVRHLEAIARRMVAVSADVRIEPLPRTRAPGRSLALSAALLVDRAAEERFQALAWDLNAEHTLMGLSVEVTGPRAPYAFVGEQRQGD